MGAGWGQTLSRFHALAPTPAKRGQAADVVQGSLSMPLTNIALKALKPRERSYKVADDRGLYIEVTPNGSKLWRYKYRLHGKENRLSMGRYPEISIAEARQRRDKAPEDPVHSE
jgi:hypothetical protein